MPAGNNSTVAKPGSLLRELALGFRSHHRLWELTSRHLMLGRCSFQAARCPRIELSW